MKRRSFLGGAAASLPLLNSLVSRSVTAGESGPRKRLVVFFSPNDAIGDEHWTPPGAGDDTPLTSLPGVMAPLLDRMDDLVVVGDVRMRSRDIETHSSGHIAMGHMLTGRPVLPQGANNYIGAGISVDQHIANALGVNLLALGGQIDGSSGRSRMSYRAANQPVDPIERPDDAFGSLFNTLPPDELATLRAKRLSVLDRVSGDLQLMRASVPAIAREKLDVHMELLRELEVDLENDTTLACDPGEPPAAIDYDANANFPTTARRQMDILSEALACGVTDVATIQLGSSGSGSLVPLWPDEGIEIPRNAHAIAHNYYEVGDAAAISERLQLEEFFFEMFAYLLGRLHTTPEVGGDRLLDNTLVLWVKNFGFAHSSTRMPFILAGSAGGQIQTGRYINAAGESHNNLLLSVCQLMGLDDESFGDAEVCDGPMAL